MAMTKCKECGNELSTKAEACPKCGAKIRKTSIVAKGCLTLIVVFFGLAFLGSLIDEPTTRSGKVASGVVARNSPAEEMPVAEEAEPIALQTLLGQYQDNEIRGDALFKGKLIETSGKVGDVKKDILGSIYVTVGTGRQFEIPQVQCFFEDSEASKVVRLSKGSSVTVRGRVDGLMMNVLVKECVLVSP